MKICHNLHMITEYRILLYKYKNKRRFIPKQPISSLAFGQSGKPSHILDFAIFDSHGQSSSSLASWQSTFESHN